MASLKRVESSAMMPSPIWRWSDLKTMYLSDYHRRNGFIAMEEHSEMAGYYFEVLETVEEPEAVYAGKAGEYIAVKEIEKGKHIVVVYRELGKEDGFVITAFLTRRAKQLERRRKIWGS